MAILDDFISDHSFDFATGNIRRTDLTYTRRYPVEIVHRYAMAVIYQDSATGNENGDITKLLIPSKRNSATDIDLLGDFNIDDATALGLYGGSITFNAGDDQYSGLAISGTFPTSSTAPELYQNNIKLTNNWGQSLSPDPAKGYAVRVLIRSRIAGVDIDGGRIRGVSRGYGYKYSEGATLLGRNESVLGLGAITADNSNQTLEATIAGYTDIANTEGYQLIDLNNGAGSKPYYSQWDYASRTPAALYERLKWLTRAASSSTVYGLTGDKFRGITHSIAYDGLAGGSFTESSSVTFESGATAQILADSGTVLYVQLLTGFAPEDNDTITQGGVTALVNGTPSAQTLNIADCPFGFFAGSWLGAFGVGFDDADLVVADKLIALDGTQQSPPNNQVGIVSGGTPTETKVFLGPSDGAGGILENEYSLAAGNNSGNGTIVIAGTIGVAPTTGGFVRVDRGDGNFDKYEYSSKSGSTFTLVGTLAQNYATSADCYVAWFDEIMATTPISRTYVYTGTPKLLIGQAVEIDNDSPKVPAPITATAGANGFPITLNLVDDA